MLVLADPPEAGGLKHNTGSSGFTARCIQGKRVFPVTQRHGLISNNNSNGRINNNSNSNNYSRRNAVATIVTTKVCSSTTEESTSDNSTSAGDSRSSESTSTSGDVEGISEDELVMLQNCQPTFHDLAAEAGSSAVNTNVKSNSQEGLKDRDNINSVGPLEPPATKMSHSAESLSTQAYPNRPVSVSATGDNVSLEDDDLPIFEEVMIDDSSESNKEKHPSVSFQQEQTGKDLQQQQQQQKSTFDEAQTSLQKLISRTVRKAVQRQKQRQRRANPSADVSKPKSSSGIKTSSKKRQRVVEYSDSEESDIQDLDSTNSENGSTEKEGADLSEPDSELSNDRGARSSHSNQKKKNTAASKKTKATNKSVRSGSKIDTKAPSSSSKIAKTHVKKKYPATSKSTSSSSSSSATAALLESLAEFSKVQAQLSRQLAALKRAVNAK
jgi:hypothetical protein